MRSLLTVALILVMFFSYSCQKKSEYQLSTSVRFEQINYEDALVLANQQNKRIMVDFWSPG